MKGLAATLPKAYPSRVLEVREECPGVKTFRLEVPGDFRFIPGMWVMLNLPDAPRLSRAYSIASSPLARGYLETTLNRVGALTSRLFELKGGEVLTLRGPYGKWLYTDDIPHAVLISGGTGITPYLSMCRYVLEKGLPNRLTLLYSARTPSDIPYRGDLARFAREGLKVFVTITRPQALEPGQAWEGPIGRLTIETIEREADGFAKASFFLCGPVSLVEDLGRALRERGIPQERIHTEKWGMY